MSRLGYSAVPERSSMAFPLEGDNPTWRFNPQVGAALRYAMVRVGLWPFVPIWV